MLLACTEYADGVRCSSDLEFASAAYVDGVRCRPALALAVLVLVVLLGSSPYLDSVFCSVFWAASRSASRAASALAC